jgi:hypothetical protein
MEAVKSGATEDHVVCTFEQEYMPPRGIYMVRGVLAGSASASISTEGTHDQRSGNVNGPASTTRPILAIVKRNIGFVARGRKRGAPC